VATSAATPDPALTARPWARFFEKLGRDGFHDLDRRTLNLQRQLRDNGVTYNVYADADGPQRPWSLACSRSSSPRTAGAGSSPACCSGRGCSIG